jgi:hypothetical protein
MPRNREKIIMHAMRTVVFLLLITVVVSACAATHSSDTPFLLEQDFHAMSDQELIAYEQELSDAVLRRTRSSNSDVSLGVGFGSWGSSGGVGVGVDRWLGGGQDERQKELWDRREAVRGEMQKRGLIR